MSVKKYFSKNKVGGLILIIVIIIAFGFGGFGGGFLSNNQNNIVKINKTNVTKQDLINYINQSGIDKKAIQDNLDNNIIEELLSGLVSNTLLDLEVKNFEFYFSEKSLSKKIKFNKNFFDENGVFQRIKYEKFLLENNISAPIFEKRLKDREIQKKLFDFIGAGTVSPEFLVTKLYENENRKLEIDYINLNPFYKSKKSVSDQEIEKFIQENSDRLKIEYIDFQYSIINPQLLIGLNEFNEDFFNKIDEIENDILNEISLDAIASKFDFEIKNVNNYRYSEKSNTIEKKIYQLRSNKIDIFENGDDFIIYNIKNIEKRKPNIEDLETKNEILELITQKNKFDYNRKLLEQINSNKFNENDFLQLGKDKIKTLIFNSIKDNKKFEINSVEILYTMPMDTFTLINDDKDQIYIAQIKKYMDLEIDKKSKDYKLFKNKENSQMRNSILKSYDFLLNNKYKVDINQTAINSVRNLFQ